MKKVQMSPGILVGGAPQSFCFPEGHEVARCFKGMKAILEERGFGDQIRDLGRECPKFRFPPDRTVTDYMWRLYPPNALLSQPGCDFSTQGTPGSAVLRCSSPLRLKGGRPWKKCRLSSR